jgi:hypothetical protein
MTDQPRPRPLADADAIITTLQSLGLLLLSDPKRNNTIQILTGEFPKGSWWSHPQANQIYDVLQMVEQHPDVLLAKLIAGKVTLVHRNLWPALLAVVTARESWQMEGLSPGAVKALAALDAGQDPAASRTVSKEIEARLLARAENVHGAAGRHETRLEPWSTWATRAGCPAAWPLPRAKTAIEEAAARLGPPTSLPWQG